ncbi:MAG: response regulator [Cyanobacteriota bacterium]|nr:response regulator [Cyanobacteriota bacterium]
MIVKKILVIDDEADIREVAKLSIEINSNWEVLSAHSGESGFSLARTHGPDAILLDVMMPDMDGLTTLAKLQSHPETLNIPVILLTAKVQSAEQRRYAKLGVAAVLTKPFDPVLLVEQIAGVLNWNQS